tara:strand:+ start:6820 stop:7392 length:573 start_codon:yes stop_codon:yes gene_type:complete
MVLAFQNRFFIALGAVVIGLIGGCGDAHARIGEKKTESGYQKAAPVPLETLQARSKPPIFRTLQWSQRALVITGEPDDPLVAQQLQILRDNIPGLADRKLAAIRFMREDLDEIDEISDYNYRGWYDMDANEQRFMEKQLGVDNNKFSVVLVGLDGELKQVWSPVDRAVPIKWIFDAIDAMPMREREENKK